MGAVCHRQYCDQTVPDGFGGTEPRMTLMRTWHNSVRRGTFSVISALDALYAGMERPDADVCSGPPVDVVWPYTNSDVVVDDNGVGSATASVP